MTRVWTNGTCPVPFSSTISVQFDVSTHTSRSGLSWQTSLLNSDSTSPKEGTLPSNGNKTVTLTDIALDNVLSIEIFDGNGVLLTLEVDHH